MSPFKDIGAFKRAKYNRREPQQIPEANFIPSFTWVNFDIQGSIRE